MDGFIVVGNKNAITYKEIFPYLKDNKMWLGYNSPKEFDQPDGDEPKVMNGLTRWFTNLEHNKRKEFIGLTKKYNSTDYPKYDNFDAIEVSKVTDIPKDYDGVMGVPITYLDKYNPNQFEIVGMCENLDLYGLKTKIYTADECKKAYYSKFGKNGVYDLNASGVLIKNSLYEKVYQRILIRKIKELPTEEEVKNIAE